MENQYEVVCALSNGDVSNDVYRLRTHNPVFKVTACLKSNISKMVRFRDNVTKEH